MLLSTNKKTKGVVVVGLVNALQQWKRTANVARVPGLEPQDDVLMDSRVLASSWYPHNQYLRVLRACWQTICGEDPFRFDDFIRAGAKRVYAGAQRPLIREGDPGKTASSIRLLWKSCHNFATPGARVEPGHALVAFDDYEDATEFEATVNLLWIATALEQSGAVDVVSSVAEAPWTDHPRLVLEFRWST